MTNTNRNKEAYAKRYDEAALYRENNRTLLAIRQLGRKYNVTLDAATDLFERSTASCDCCGVTHEASEQKYRFAVDHNHETGEVRGLLCGPCNTSLGLLKEDDSKILALLNYNRKHNG